MLLRLVWQLLFTICYFVSTLPIYLQFRCFFKKKVNINTNSSSLRTLPYCIQDIMYSQGKRYPPILYSDSNVISLCSLLRFHEFIIEYVMEPVHKKPCDEVQYSTAVTFFCGDSIPPKLPRNLMSYLLLTCLTPLIKIKLLSLCLFNYQVES